MSSDSEEFEAFRTVKSLLDSIDADKLKLDEELVKIEANVARIEQLVYVDRDGIPGEFVSTDDLLRYIDVLSHAVGYAIQLVLEMERNIAPLEEALQQKPQSNPNPNPQPIIVQPQNQKPEKKGFWSSLLGGYYEYKTLRLQMEMQQKLESEPTITKSQEIKDVLQFGRQIIPTLNEIKEWLKGCKCRLYFFHDKNVYYCYHVQLQAYLGKVLGIVQSFAKSCMEYRKKELDRLKIELGKAVAQIATAEAYATGQRQIIQIPQPVSPGGFTFPTPQKRKPPQGD